MAKSAKAVTKSDIFASIAQTTELSRKQVASVFEALSGQIKAAVGKKGPGVFALPGLAKIVVVQKPAVPKQGHQSVHQAGAGLRSQARPQGHQGPPA
jgi:nucleoid DNA-binding protein